MTKTLLGATVPGDFPNFEGGQELAIVDTLIVMLFQERAALSDPTWRRTALARIECARRALMPSGNAPNSIAMRHEMLVNALDRGSNLGSIEIRVGYVQLALAEAMPDATLKGDVVRAAVALWPELKRRGARTSAVRALARSLACDAPSLMTMLRQARKRIRERK